MLFLFPGSGFIFQEKNLEKRLLLCLGVTRVTFGTRQTKVLIGEIGGHPSARRALNETALDQEGLVDVLDGVFFFADRAAQGFDSDRTALKFFDDGQ